METRKAHNAALASLRCKFVFTNMLFVVLVLAAVIAGVTYTTIQQRTSEVYDALEHAATEMVDRQLGAPDPSMQVPAGNDFNRDDMSRRESSGDQFVATALYFADADGNMTSTVFNSLGLDEDAAASAVYSAVSLHTEKGRLGNANLYYQVRRLEDGTYAVAMVSSNFVDRTIWSLLNALILAALVALVAFFIMSLFLSRWALRPVEEAWDRQQRFIADASHELKTPLTVILANNSILASRPEATVASQSKWIESTETEGRLLQGLVNDMLYLAKSDNTEHMIDVSDVDFSDCVEESVLQFESVAFEHGVMIDSDIEESVLVNGDAARLERLVGTLLDNACKYVDEGGHVSVTLRRKETVCCLSVNNTGVAIAADDLPHLFDRFYRTDKARTRTDRSGFGLGLSIAQAIASDHGGAIEAASNEEDGTTFAVTLPCI